MTLDGLGTSEDIIDEDDYKRIEALVGKTLVKYHGRLYRIIANYDGDRAYITVAKDDEPSKTIAGFYYNIRRQKYVGYRPSLKQLSFLKDFLRDCVPIDIN